MIYPPRAEYRIEANSIDEFPAADWVGEPKLNGTALIVICIGSIVTTMNRHGKVYSTKISNTEYRNIFPHVKDFTVCGEYMNKAQDDETGKPLRDKFIIWDLISFDGEDLLGKNLMERKQILINNTKGKKSKRPYVLSDISENISIIKTFEKDLKKVYTKLISIPLVEGLVLKRRTAALKPFARPDNNTDWQVKVRKPTKCYKF